MKPIKSELRGCLENAGIDFGAVPGLNHMFEEENPLSNPFEHVSTKYQQNAYFPEHFGPVVSSVLKRYCKRFGFFKYYLIGKLGIF